MRQVVLDGETIDVTENMLLACIVDIHAGMVRMPLECKHTAAIASMLHNQEVYLDGPPLNWNWKLSSKGRELEAELQAHRFKSDTSHKIRCPLCEAKPQAAKHQFTYGVLTDSGNINGAKPGQVVLLCSKSGGKRVKDNQGM